MRIILWPALISLAITLLRLVGELQGWSTRLFNPAAGGGGAIVGISWLPFLFGPYFAWKLAQGGHGPRSAWKVAGMALLAIAVIVAMFVAINAAGLGVGFAVASFFLSLLAAFIPWKAWPELGKLLLAYALAARVPVAIVMLIAMYGNWGTHYDVLPPDPPPQLVAMGPFGRWVAIGLIPQLTLWVAHTMLVGTLFGALLLAVARRKPVSVTV
jgi:hypothetical protein